MCSEVNTKWSFSLPSLKFVTCFLNPIFLKSPSLEGKQRWQGHFLPKKVNSPPRSDREHSLGGILETHQVLLRKKEMRRLLYLPHLR